MGELKGPLEANWTSYGICLGNTNREMTARDILALGAALEGKAIASSGVAGTFKEQLWMATICAAPFRLHSGLRPDYKREITNRIADYLESLVQEDQFSLIDFIGTRGQWEQDKRYSKIIAAIDMFLVRFPSDESSRLRLCTIGARYKDCAALVGVEYLRKLINVSFGELFLWVWTRGIVDDMRRVFKKDEELTVMHSYLPEHFISSSSHKKEEDWFFV